MSIHYGPCKYLKYLKYPQVCWSWSTKAFKRVVKTSHKNQTTKEAAQISIKFDCILVTFFYLFLLILLRFHFCIHFETHIRRLLIGFISFHITFTPYRLLASVPVRSSSGVANSAFASRINLNNPKADHSFTPLRTVFERPIREVIDFISQKPAFGLVLSQGSWSTKQSGWS